jgi:catechol 2,3-dioxygenase-like lactoylglutathione lyase family enzyme
MGLPKHLVLTLLACSVPFALPAKPLPEAEQGPVDVRRATLIVRDIDKSLALYRDAIGLKVVYDQKIGGGTGADGKAKPPTVRLVLLRANDDFVGLLGLMQRLDDPDPPPATIKRPMAGNVIVLINAKDLETRFERIKAAPGVSVHTPPTPIEYPAPGGGKIPVIFSAIYDADGFFIEINKLLGQAAGTENRK